MATCCVPLRSRSNYSLLTGTAPVEDLVRRAAKLGYRSLALTDRDGIYGAVPFFEAARAAGVRPILGAEVTESAAHGNGGVPESVVLLARDRAGLGSLGTILTARHLDPEFDLAAAVAAHSRGLHVIVDTLAVAERLRERGVGAGGNGAPCTVWLEATPRRGDGSRVAAEIADARRIGVRPVAGGRGCLIRAGDLLLHEVLVAIRENTMVGSVDRAELARPEDYLRAPWEMESVLGALPEEIRAEALANSVAVADSCGFELSEGHPILPRAPVAAGESELDLLRARTLEGLERRYGEGASAAGRRTATYRQALRRLERELEVIGRMGFEGYFLIVGEIARFARERGIPVVGRGSGASSMVAYVLDVTSVDPIRHGLLFERFLNEKRPDLPDLDLDFCWKRRDEVIEHVYETYGRDRVAMISTHVTYGPRSAFRDVARAYGIPLDRVNLLSGMLPHDVPDPGGSVGGEVMGAPPGGAGARLSPVLMRILAPEVPIATSPWPEILEATVAMQGFPRHLGVHPGGVVIADRPLAEIVPLEEATKGIVVTQYEMRGAEAVGLVKIDLLANRALTEVAETARLVAGGEAPAAAGVVRPTLDITRIPEADALTARLLERGDTLGCFQIESPGMRNLLCQLGTQSLAGTIDAHSLIRPGPASSGVKEEFVRRTRAMPVRRSADGTVLGRAWAHAGLAAHVGEQAAGGGEASGGKETRREAAARGGGAIGAGMRALAHPELAEILTGTHGVMLYEEDVMRVAAWLVGGDLAEGDEIRRAIAGSTPEELGEVGEFLIRRAVARGLGAAVAEAVWGELRRFAAYTFCKAHAAGYGVLAYQTAYLKAHHPAAFAVALMNHHQGMYPRRAHLADARRHGVAVRPPCVNRSAREWTLEEGEARVGLAEVRGIHEKTLDAIVAARGGEADAGAAGRATGRAFRPFRSLGDFLARVPATRPEVEAFILVGAFDFTGRPRPELVWELRTGKAERVREEDPVWLWDAWPPAGEGARGVSGLVAGAGSRRGRRAPALEDFGPEERLQHEWEFLEMGLTMHPTETRAARELARGCMTAAELTGAAGGTASLLGVAIARRRIRTSRGETMMFLTLEDASGVAECTLFPPAWRRFGTAARSEGLIRVTGRVENQYGAITLTAEGVEAFPLFQRNVAAPGASETAA